MAENSIDVYVKLSMGRNVQYDLHPDNNIGDVIELVTKDEGVAANQVRLKYQGKILVSTKTLRQYGVRAETILKSEVLVPKELALVVNLPDDRSETMIMSNLQSASALMKVISDKSGAKETRLDVEYKGQKIKSSSSKLLELGIENNAEIKVTIKDEEIPPEVCRAVKDARKELDEINETMDDEAKESVLSSFQTHGKKVEVVFSFDTTGSMYRHLKQVREKLKECCRRLIQDIPNIRIGIIAHGDYCDQLNYYVIRSMDLSNDVDALTNFAWDVPATEGGDSPECYEWVLRKAQHLDWAEDSAKALVVIGDYFPHPPSYTDQNIHWRDELNVLKGMEVKVYGVQVGCIHPATSFYAEMADMTGGKHLKLSHFDLITDMFLAVCYREGSEELLDEFQQEIQDAGRMSEQARAMFEELKETEADRAEKDTSTGAAAPANPERYVRAEWWDHTLRSENKKPLYIYDSGEDVWKENRNPAPSSTVRHHGSDTPSVRLSTSARGSSKKKRSRKCIIM